MKTKNIKQYGLFIIAFMVLCVYLIPIINLALSSFKPAVMVTNAPPKFLPSPFTVENYVAIFTESSILKYLLNSIIVALGSTIIAIFLGAMAAWVVARFASLMTQFFMIFTLIARVIPPVTIAVPILTIINTMGLKDTHMGLMIVHASINLPFVIWMLSSFFGKIPFELEEAALIDGCSRFQSFQKVILPIMLPAIATTAVFTMMLSWNDFLFALLLTDKDAVTGPLFISRYLSAYTSEWGQMAAAGTLFTLPILTLSVFIQKRIVEGMTMGAVKG